VRLARPIIQTAVIEVTARNRASACHQALGRAASISDKDWSAGKFDGREYGVHIEDVIDNQQIYETSARPHREIREFRYGGASGGSTRYVLLAADLKTKEGYLLTQPWFANTSNMLQGDLCSDWTEPLAFIVENDGFDASMVRISGAAWNRKGGCGEDEDNVIEFPASPLDEEVVESSS
jgi:hypothetical protein